MNKWIIWTSDHEGDFVRADKMMRDVDTVSFEKGGKIVATYKRGSYKKISRVE